MSTKTSMLDHYLIDTLERIAKALEEIANDKRDPYRPTVFSQKFLETDEGRAKLGQIQNDVFQCGLNADFWAGFNEGYECGKNDGRDEANAKHAAENNNNER